MTCNGTPPHLIDDDPFATPGGRSGAHIRASAKSILSSLRKVELDGNPLKDDFVVPIDCLPTLAAAVREIIGAYDRGIVFDAGHLADIKQALWLAYLAAHFSIPRDYPADQLTISFMALHALVRLKDKHRRSISVERKVASKFAEDLDALSRPEWGVPYGVVRFPPLTVAA